MLTRIVAFTGAAAAIAVGISAGQEPQLATVLDRMASYATTFQRDLANIVAEEQYVQDVRQVNVLPGRFAGATHRELRSDLLLVRPTGSDGYVAFRDVFEVDGKPTRDRRQRLTALFLEPLGSAESQIERINQESARYNIGNIERTTNTPTLALLMLVPANQPRFRFTRSRSAAPALARSAPPNAFVVDFEETRRPTLIRTTRGLDLPAHGRLWIDPANGRLLMSELTTEEPLVRATISVSYQWDAAAGLMIPSEMRERYEGRRDGVVIEGRATYGSIRRFQVQSTERIGSADVPTAAPVPVEPQQAAAPIARTEPQKPDAPIETQPVPPSQTFAARTELVLVDLVVTDRADRPVRGLKAKDFVVKEDGRERPIVSFDAFASNVAAVPAAVGTVPTARSTLTDTRPSTVILVDDLQLSQEQAARLRPALTALLRTTGRRGSRVMVVAPNSNVSRLVEPERDDKDLSPTVALIAGRGVEDHSSFPLGDAEALAIAAGDLRVLARAVARFQALNPELTGDQAEQIARERANMLAHDARARREVIYDAIVACLDWLGGQPGRHNVIVVSPGFAADPDDGRFREVATRSLRVNAPINFLDTRGLPGISRYAGIEYSPMLGRNADEGPFGWAQAAEGAVDLAVETGGVAAVGSNDMAKGLGELLEAITNYYVIAYQPLAHDKAGYHRIKVDVRGRGLHVRARRGYFSQAAPAR